MMLRKGMAGRMQRVLIWSRNVAVTITKKAKTTNSSFSRKNDLFKKAKTEESLKDLEFTFNNFKAKASENEEYANLINELTKDLVFNNANTQNIKEELESILTFGTGIQIYSNTASIELF